MSSLILECVVVIIEIVNFTVIFENKKRAKTPITENKEHLAPPYTVNRVRGIKNPNKCRHPKTSE